MPAGHVLRLRPRTRTPDTGPVWLCWRSPTPATSIVRCASLRVRTAATGRSRNYVRTSRLFWLRGPLDVLQLSGGEPLLHPDLLTLIDHCRQLPIDQVMLNTNGLELLRGDGLAAALAARRRGLQLFLQLDGLDAESHLALRGADLLARKRAVLEVLVRHDLPTNLACTIVRGVNEQQVGELLTLGMNTPQIRGITYQPATWSGRFEQAIDPLDRITLADVIRLLAQQSGGLLTEADFRPLPCSHPNCCSFTFVARRRKGSPLALTRLARYEDHAEQLADRVNFKLADAQACCGFGERPEDLFRVVVKPFMDAYTFDEERADECCIHVIRPGGEAVSFCRFNTLLRQTVGKTEDKVRAHA